MSINDTSPGCGLHRQPRIGACVNFRRCLRVLLLGTLINAQGTGAMPTGDDESSDLDAGMIVSNELGLMPHAIRLAAAGYVLDFRYRVLASERAAKVINRETAPYLIEEATGMKVSVPAPPKIGPLRNTGGHLEEGRTYFILFANPAKKIRRGDRVTIVLGEHRIEHLIVQ